MNNADVAQITSTKNPTRTLCGAMCLGEFLKRGFDADAELLGKMILAKSIGMIAGQRGGGKSWLAMLIAYAIAGGKHLEPWGTGCGATVVYLDGEMRAAGLQERLRLLHARNSKPESIEQVEKFLHIVSRDSVGVTIGSIDDEAGQKCLDKIIPTDTQLIIIDNHSAWTSGGREDSNSWAAIKLWLIQKRLAGIAVLLIHHAGKNGQQRGSSAHEDLLDYSILLSPLPSDLDHQDTRFLVKHTKLRDYIPELKQDFEYSIYVKDDALQFEVKPAVFQISKRDEDILRLHNEGLTLEVIGKSLGINKSTVSRRLKILLEQQPDDEEAVTE